MLKKLSRSEHFWKIGSAKCAPNCSESSMCTSKCQKTVTFGTLLEDWVGKMCARLQRQLDVHFKMLKNCHILNTFGRLGRQNVHQTVARARCALQNVQKLSHSEHFWKIRSAKCAPDCSKGSMHFKMLKNCHIRDTFGRLGRQNERRTVARARCALQNVKKLLRSEHFWQMRSAK